MPPMVTLPPEGTYSDIERDFIDNEPPGLFPGDQNSVWGQVRKVYADYMQLLADQITQWYVNLDPSTTDEADARNWERELNVPVEVTGLSIIARRTFLQARLQRGPFTRTRRRQIVESFITEAIGGAAIEFTADGVPFTAGGTPFGSDVVGLAGSYAIVENIPGFSYDVQILSTITVDTPGLTRELERITPAGINFTISALGGGTGDEGQLPGFLFASEG